jgi:hypothetical protein
MLPSLRIILAAVIAACAAVLTLSAGLVGARDPARNISGVPDRAGSACLNRISASISGGPAEVRLPSGAAAG